MKEKMGFEEEIDFEMSAEDLQLYKDTVTSEYFTIFANKEVFVKTDKINDGRKVQKLYEILDLFILEGMQDETINQIESLIDVLTIKILIEKDIIPSADI
jgi:hypothetical protein